jgi:hypothetical protein
VSAGEVGIDVSLAGLLLGEGVGAVAGAEGAQQGAAVGAAEVVALSAAAVKKIDSPPWVSRTVFSRAAISRTAVSQSVGLEVPSCSRRRGVVRRPPFW